MVTVIENQQAQLALLREENAALRARLALPPHAQAEGVPADENAEALASLIDLATARTHAVEPSPPVTASSPSAKRPRLEGGAPDRGAASGQPAHAQVVQAWPGFAPPAAVRPIRPAGADGAELAGEDRRCTTCGTRDTPKWRNGNRLCNACGLRNAKQASAQRSPQPRGAGSLGAAPPATVSSVARLPGEQPPEALQLAAQALGGHGRAAPAATAPPAMAAAAAPGAQPLASALAPLHTAQPWGAPAAAPAPAPAQPPAPPPERAPNGACASAESSEAPAVQSGAPAVCAPAGARRRGPSTGGRGLARLGLPA